MTSERRRQSGKNLNTNYQTLESRRMFAAATASIETFQEMPQLVIEGTRDHDEVVVSDASDDRVQVSMQTTDANGQAGTMETVFFNKQYFDRIRFLGRKGDDTFINNTTVDSSASGHEGDDVLNGGNGHNWLRGGGGDDHLVGGDSNDALRGRAGNDYLDGGKRHDNILGHSGDDVILGKAGHDVIFGNDGDDEIYGGNGDDLINGGAGSDRIFFGSSAAQGDVALYDAAFEQYEFDSDDARLEVSGPNANPDVLQDADTLRFSDVDKGAATLMVNLSAVERASLELLNQFRINNNLSTLELKADITEFAQRWAREEVAPLGPNPTQHELFDAHVDGIEDIAELLNSERTTYRENLSYLGPQVTSPQQAAQQLHDLLVNSPSHRDNMLSDISEVGIGIVKTSDGWYLVHSFFET